MPAGTAAMPEGTAVMTEGGAADGSRSSDDASGMTGGAAPMIGGATADGSRSRDDASGIGAGMPECAWARVRVRVRDKVSDPDGRRSCRGCCRQRAWARAPVWALPVQTAGARWYASAQ